MVFAMFLSSVCAFVRLQMQRAEYKDMLARIKDYLRESRLSKSLQQKVRHEFAEHSEMRSPFYSEHILLQCMPTCIAYECVRKSYAKMMNPIPFFKECEATHPGVLMLAAMWIEPMMCQRGECLYRRGVGHQYVFFIKKGAVDIDFAPPSAAGAEEGKGEGKARPAKATRGASESFGEAMLLVPYSYVFKANFSAFASE